MVIASLGRSILRLFDAVIASEDHECAVPPNVPNALRTETIDTLAPIAILGRIARGDRSAAKECIDMYGDWVWSVAIKKTESAEVAETLARDIFLQIWLHADRFDSSGHDERTFIAMIARRRVREHLKTVGSVSNQEIYVHIDKPERARGRGETANPTVGLAVLLLSVWRENTRTDSE